MKVIRLPALMAGSIELPETEIEDLQVSWFIKRNFYLTLYQEERTVKLDRMKIALPKKIGWILITLLVFWDAFLTYLGGSEGNPLWKPIIQTYGINALWVLIPVALGIFYLATKIFGWLIKSIDKIAEGEEIVLTGLVLVFATYDLYITFLLRSFGWLGSRGHYSIILLLMVPVIGYIIYTEIARRKNK